VTTIATNTPQFFMVRTDVNNGTSAVSPSDGPENLPRLLILLKLRF
jgi:hypothetical protein